MYFKFSNEAWYYDNFIKKSIYLENHSVGKYNNTCTENEVPTLVN